MCSTSDSGLNRVEVAKESQWCVQPSRSSGVPQQLIDDAVKTNKSVKITKSVVHAQKPMSSASKSSSGGERPPEAGQGCPLQPRRQHFSRQEVMTVFKLRPNIRSMQTAECMRRVLSIRSKQVLNGLLAKHRRCPTNCKPVDVGLHSHCVGNKTQFTAPRTHSNQWHRLCFGHLPQLTEIFPSEHVHPLTRLTHTARECATETHARARRALIRHRYACGKLRGKAWPSSTRLDRAVLRQHCFWFCEPETKNHLLPSGR
jgi:hypothetical protein